MNKMGFGFLRLPMKDNKVDIKLTQRLADDFIAKGGRYFDTAYTYLDGKSETAFKQAVADRYERDRYEIADKLPSWMVKNHEECYAYFKEQLERCGVRRFDVYLLHWLNGENYKTAEATRQFEFLKELKEKGLAGRIGFSYHDSAALLDEILAAHPEIDIVQLQVNYLDWKARGIESEKCCLTAAKHGKSIIVMEPVKGGTLAVLPQKAAALLEKKHPERSPASWALGFAQSVPGVERVLSGMNDPLQISENMANMEPMSDEEKELLLKAAEIIKEGTAVGCTGCRYCTSYCPIGMMIPDIFSLYNEINRYPAEGWKIKPVYESLTQKSVKASSCIGCGACAQHCPQKLAIPGFLKMAAEALEK